MPAAKQSKRVINADIAVIGAGIVGLTFALEMAHTGLNIVVVNKGALVDGTQNVTSDVTSFSPRVSAISHASDVVFRRLGAWSQITRMQPYTDMHVWDKDSFGEIAFSAQELKSEYLGHIVENNVLEAALHAQIGEHNNIEVLENTALRDIHQESQYAHLLFETPIEIKAKLVVGADGAHSAVKSLLKLPETFWDYDHTAIVTTIGTETPHQNTAKQVFTPFGPLAFLPLADEHQVSIVWSQQSKRAQQLLALSEKDFCNALFVAIDGAYGQCTLLDKRYSFPLRMRYSRQWVKGSIVLAGDAAHTIHPLAGQGANLGIADVCALASILSKAVDSGEAINSPKRLREYERWRKAEAIKTIATMEAFKRGFDGDQGIKKLLRGIALVTADRIKPIKSFFIRQASGY